MKQTIAYETTVSTRAKRVRLSVYEDGRVILTIPKRCSRDVAARFVERHARWIASRLERFQKRRARLTVIPGRHFEEEKERALAFAEEHLKRLNAAYGFTYHLVRVKNQKSKWGSCSRKGAINVNYKILYLPPLLVDYLLVHELCHLKEMNHGPRFWQLVGQTVPDYKERRKQLRLIDVKIV
ncbi:MAG: SprT family zinc-dependent metalloprotease [bacterium]|nr:SprT family zinc-dependent metalloprotease [bacterium]